MRFSVHTGETTTRFTVLIPVVIALVLSGASFAQSCVEFVIVEDRFRTNFPDEPTAKDIVYLTEDGEALPARRYSVERDEGYYAVTSIDFAMAYEAHASTVQGAMAHAATSYRRLGEVTFDAYARLDRIPAHELQLTEPDGRRTFVLIVLHQDQDMDARRLYIVEASVPAGSTPPMLFQISLEIIDANGNGIRYAPDLVTRVPFTK